jgi:hypothetical protein
MMIVAWVRTNITMKTELQLSLAMQFLSVQFLSVLELTTDNVARLQAATEGVQPRSSKTPKAGGLLSADCITIDAYGALILHADSVSDIRKLSLVLLLMSHVRVA